MSKLRRKSPFFNILFAAIGFLVILLLSGCVSMRSNQTPIPTATLTQTLTPSPTIIWFPATPTATPIPGVSPTPQPTFPSQREGISALLVDDDFTDERLWQTSQSAAGNIAYGRESLTLAVSESNASLTSISQHTLPENFYLEISMQLSLCQPEDQIGVLFWYANTGEYYRLLLTCEGRYRLELIQGGQSVVIHNWETASQMNLATPATNRLGLWAYQGRFQFFIDDIFQFEEKIAQKLNGSLGLFARTQTGNAMTVRFSDLQIYQVDIQE